ncbi:hypothetical protein HanXRQr2_Chr15g0710831 [Helianthus annuus]|uniref:Uncharacterized protein n=1 Tax=Helianthus annuus TaxID=4232 RepID=A0A9K3E372_HELAN|nr:hypothetical protein HanXRQr2_Chr15g0710831 [Helianthus annuus]
MINHLRQKFLFSRHTTDTHYVTRAWQDKLYMRVSVSAARVRFVYDRTTPSHASAPPPAGPALPRASALPPAGPAPPHASAPSPGGPAPSHVSAPRLLVQPRRAGPTLPRASAPLPAGPTPPCASAPPPAGPTPPPRECTPDCKSHSAAARVPYTTCPVNKLCHRHATPVGAQPPFATEVAGV